MYISKEEDQLIKSITSALKRYNKRLKEKNPEVKKYTKVVVKQRKSVFEATRIDLKGVAHTIVSLRIIKKSTLK